MPFKSSDSSSSLQQFQQAISDQAFLQECTGSPPDRPHWDSAVRVAMHALKEVCDQYPQLTGYLSHLKQGLPADTGAPANRNPLYGRMEGHQLYSAILKLDQLTVVSHEHWKPVMTITGAWMLRRYLTGVEPKPSSLRNLVLALKHEGMQAEALARMQAKALGGLSDAIAQAPARAAQLGLCEPPVKKTLVSDSNERFRIEYQRHFAQLIKYAPEGSVQATSGHGALSSSGLRQAGLQLRLQVEAEEDQGMVLCLQVLTWLTPGLLKQLPVVSDSSHSDYPAWLDLLGGTYCYQLSLVVDLRDAPEDETRALYLPSADIVRVPLPQFLLKALRERFKRTATSTSQSVVTTIGDLIDVSDVSPRSSIQESEGYRITVRRVQESLAPAALESGHHRWPVGLATSAFWLVSKGRRAYSVCSSSRILVAAQAVHKALGWVDSRHLQAPDAEVFIGSAVCPKPEAIIRALAFMNNQCAERVEIPNWEWLNWVAAKTSFISCLSLALRNSVQYPLDWQGVACSESIRFTDKNVHEQPCEALPVVQQLKGAMQEWNASVAMVLEHESGLAHDHGKQLVAAVKASGRSGLFPVGEVQAGAVWSLASTGTWRLRLPPSLRLVPNFGRHFWPWALEEHGVHQKLVDLLMRHQTTYLPQAGVNVSWPPARQREKLRVAMEEILQQIWVQAGVLQ